ncbi:MAG: ferrous iron transport protein A [Candidatus Sumerlaeia bacterium]|nr:ferrous iron transport protein A [Candidatus Sumerlaeia bacterium]
MPKLSDVPPDSRVRIRDLGNSPLLQRRLMEMGLVPGTPVRVVRRAPLGDPIDLEVRGYHLSLRESEAGLIEVEAL